MKERLVGAAVLVGIAVWLIPWVLDGPEAPLATSGGALQLPAAEEPMPMRSQTLRLGDAPEADGGSSAAAAPAPAESEPARAAAPPPVEVASAPATAGAGAPTVAAVRPEPESAATAAVTSAPAAAAPPKPAPAARPAAGDWIVQLGSFSDEGNARRLAQRAGTFGYKAEVTSYRSDGRTLYRVRVGPARARAEADATASALKAHGIDARVVAAR